MPAVFEWVLWSLSVARPFRCSIKLTHDVFPFSQMCVLHCNDWSHSDFYITYKQQGLCDCVFYIKCISKAFFHCRYIFKGPVRTIKLSENKNPTHKTMQFSVYSEIHQNNVWNTPGPWKLDQLSGIHILLGLLLVYFSYWDMPTDYSEWGECIFLFWGGGQFFL